MVPDVSKHYITFIFKCKSAHETILHGLITFEDEGDMILQKCQELLMQ
jgi:hypothetical protein